MRFFLTIPPTLKHLRYATRLCAFLNLSTETSYDFADSDSDASDFHNHGSNVSSIVAGYQSGVYTGMAPGAGIIHLKVFPSDGLTGASFADIEDALQWVIANTGAFNIASVNLSLGAENHQSYQATSLYDEFAALAKLGVIPVVATGNEFYTESSVQGVGVPAADPNVISVGAVYDGNIGGVSYTSGATAYTTGADRITPFTQRHPDLMDILAPGAPITGANQSGGTSVMHGTSQASPHIAGIAVLAQDLAVQELGRRLTVEEFRGILQSTAVSVYDGDDENDNVTNTNQNFPRVDVLALGNGIMALDPGVISGIKFEDTNGDGDKTGDSGLSGWTIYLDDNNNGSPDSGSGTYNSADVPLGVNATTGAIRSDLTVSGVPGVITDVNVELDITHTWDDDLLAFLIAPSGNRVELFSRLGSSGDNYTDTILDDEAGTFITGGSPPFTGTFRPEGTLADLDGEDPNGIWMLEIGDIISWADHGTVNSWSVEVSYAISSEKRERLNDVHAAKPLVLIIEETSSKFLRPKRKPLRLDRLRWLARDSKVTNLSVLRGSVVNSSFKVIS